MTLKMTMSLLQIYMSEDVRTHQMNYTITKYIESVTDAQFLVKCIVKPTYVMDCEKLAFKVFIDAERMRGPTIDRNQLEGGLDFTLNISGVKEEVDGRTVLRPFKFASIQISKYFLFLLFLVPKKLRRVFEAGLQQLIILCSMM